MAYRLHRGEPLPRALRRVAREQLETAVDQLSGRTDDPPAQAVHDARKRMKKTRAVLRLARPGLGDDLYRDENRRMRDAGRRLSGVRDAEVLVATLDDLAERSPAGVAPTTTARVRASLDAERVRARRDASDGGSPPGGEVADEVRRALERIDGWPLERDGFKALRPGLKRSYRRGRRRFAAARDEPTAERLHEWRKRVKDLWYHARLLRPAWPEGMDPIVDAADELSDVLGLDHDLAVLGDAVGRHAGEIEDPAQVEALLAAIETRRRELQDAAWPLGERLYADPPKAFVRRIGEWWKAPEAESPAV
jgi:CHAD domain-containing protein